MCDEARRLRTVGFKQEMVGGAKDISIALNAALCVQNEGIVAVTLGQRLHGIGDHAIQPPQAVVSRDADAGEITEVVDGGGMQERGQLGFPISKNARRNAPEVHLKVRRRGKRGQRRESSLGDMRRFAHRKIIAFKGVPCRAWEGSRK